MKLATHPVANFVVAKAVLRLDGNALPAVMEEMGGAFGRTVKLGRTGVQRALVDRAAQTGMCEREIIEVCRSLLFVPLVLDVEADGMTMFIFGTGLV